MKGQGASIATAAAPGISARKEFRQERFTSYFPRLFAYAVSITGDETTATHVAVEAFAGTFAMPDMRESEFEVALFRSAREQCRHAKLACGPRGDRLNAREREVISLIFDAQLDRDQAGAVLGMATEAVSAAMMKALRKMRAGLGETAAGRLSPRLA